MSGMKIYKGEFGKQLELLLAPQIKAGFPSPAQDYMRESLDFNRDFIRHPEATFYGRVDGDSMVDAGIDDGDIAVIDRFLEAHAGRPLPAHQGLVAESARDNRPGDWRRKIAPLHSKRVDGLGLELRPMQVPQRRGGSPVFPPLHQAFCQINAVVLLAPSCKSNHSFM